MTIDQDKVPTLNGDSATIKFIGGPRPYIWVTAGHGGGIGSFDWGPFAKWLRTLPPVKRARRRRTTVARSGEPQ